MCRSWYQLIYAMGMGDWMGIGLWGWLYIRSVLFFPFMVLCLVLRPRSLTLVCLVLLPAQYDLQGSGEEVTARKQSGDGGH